MKAKLRKFLRGCSAQWISNISEEQIIGILDVCVNDSRYNKNIDTLKYGVDKGWITHKMIGKYQTYFFTDKGNTEILQNLKETTCITGRVIR